MAKNKYPGVEARPNSIRISFTLNGASHKRTLKAADGAPLEPSSYNMKFAANLVATIKREIDSGSFVFENYFADDRAVTVQDDTSKPKMPTVAEQLDLWLLTTKTLATSTQTGYRSAAKFWKAAPAELNAAGQPTRLVGDIPVDALLLSQLKLAINSKANKSGKTTNNYLSALIGALDLAIGDGLISKYPDTSLLRRKWQREEPDPFSLEEMTEIVQEMRRAYDSRVANLTEFWMLTGLRTSEIYGMRWKSVDFRKSEVRIHEVLVRGEYKASTKTSKARLVKLTPDALSILKAQRRHTLMLGEDSLVFDNPTDNKPWDDERDFRRSYWTPALKRLGIRYRRPYQLRHTNASMRLMCGQLPGFAAAQLGHSTDMFIQIYARWMDGAHDDIEMDKFTSFTKKTASILTSVTSNGT